MPCAFRSLLEICLHGRAWQVKVACTGTCMRRHMHAQAYACTQRDLSCTHSYSGTEQGRVELPGAYSLFSPIRYYNQSVINRAITNMCGCGRWSWPSSCSRARHSTRRSLQRPSRHTRRGTRQLSHPACVCIRAVCLHAHACVCGGNG